jgi:DNA-binding transcriptional ArsR family regulator
VGDTLREYQVSVFQALANPTRLAIIEMLREGELSVGAMQQRLGVRQANLSQHLTILRDRHTIKGRKSGNKVLYSLRGRSLTQLLDVMSRHCRANLSQSIQSLRRMNSGDSTR